MLIEIVFYDIMSYLLEGLKMNYELLGKLAMEETENLKVETSILKTRNEILHLQVAKLEANIKKLEEEKAALKSEIDSLNEMIQFKKNKEQYVSHYS